MRFFRGMGRAVLALLGVLVAAAVVTVVYLSLTEYTPADWEPVTVRPGARRDVPVTGQHITAVTWNIGYAGLGRNQNFFMDGGDMVRPDSKKDVEDNLSGIVSALVNQQADIYLLQEVDVDAKRSYYIDQTDALTHGLMMGSAFAYNYRCDFVPFPWPMIGKVQSGLMTLSRYQVREAGRESLPVSFAWPVRLANLKRCLLIQRIPVEGTDRELVIINLHLEAFDDGAGKLAQTARLMEVLRQEYGKGNYVIAGGDFNQTFPNITPYPVLSPEDWAPGQLSGGDLPRGFSYAFDASTPTCRSTKETYSGDRSKTQLYVIDGFILSDNIKINHIETIDLNFRNSDHHPVRLEFTLMEGAAGR